MAVRYSKKSAYANTPFNDHYLDVMVNRSIPKFGDDEIVVINDTYNMRPDLLAFDLYSDSELWWVFANRNPDVLKNPLLDFSTGTAIFIPRLETLRDVLGF